MTLLRIKMLLVLSILIIFINCDDSPTDSKGDTPIIPENNHHFPNSVGMLWKYEIYDSISNHFDTLLVSATRVLTLESGEVVTGWTEKRMNPIYCYDFDWHFLRFREDTLDSFGGGDIDPNIDGYFSENKIIFPLELGSSWAGETAPNDSTTVTQIGQIQVPAGIYDNAAMLDRTWDLGYLEGGTHHTQSWIVPDIGIVSKYHHSYDFNGYYNINERKETFVLIDYDLSTFNVNNFPLSIGNVWIYEEIDSIAITQDSFSVTIDTLIVTAIGTGSNESGDPFTELKHVTSNDTCIYHVYEHTWGLAFRGDTTAIPSTNHGYIMPMAIGKNWGLDFFIQPSETVDKGPVTTPIQTFESSFHFRFYGGGINETRNRNDWLVPDVGIVKSIIVDVETINHSYTKTRIINMSLIGYNLVE